VGTIVSNPGIAQGRPSAGRFAGRWAQGKLKTETGPPIRGWKAVAIGRSRRICFGDLEGERARLSQVVLGLKSRNMR